ncbi:hypothetical protein SUGI_1199010 [Cryptomeria japonica]|nr:hypothetical protein SUGI_1199010 [Cryptomeria japonica]
MQETGAENSTGWEVLNKLKRDGDFDYLTQKLLDRLKKNGELRNYIVSKVEQCFVLNKPGAEITNPRQLYDAILDEIKNPVLEKISEATWKVLDSEDELGKEVNEICEGAYLQICDTKHKAPPSPEVSSSNSLNSFDWELIEPPGFTRSVGQQFVCCELQQSLSHSFDQQLMDGGGQQLGGREDKESTGPSFSVGKDINEPPGYFATEQKSYHRELESYSNDNKPFKSVGLVHLSNHQGPKSYDPVLPYRHNQSDSDRGVHRKKPSFWRGSNSKKF